MWKHILLVLSYCCFVNCLPEQGKWILETKSRPGTEYVGISKSLFSGSKINLKVKCDGQGADPLLNISIVWVLRKTACWKEIFYFSQDEDHWYPSLFNNPHQSVNYTKPHYPAAMTVDTGDHECNDKIILVSEDTDSLLTSKNEAVTNKTQMAGNQAAANEASKLASQDALGKGAMSRVARATGNNVVNTSSTEYPSGRLPQSDRGPEGTPKTSHTIATVPADGIYLLIVHTDFMNQPYSAKVEIEMRANYGYLSAADWPLLGFYSAMCVVYVMYGTGWLVVCFMRWRELLRVQYWIGAVIFLGMLEKAMFTAEYQSINSTGISVRGLIIAAEIVSCAKRTLAYMLVIIVSLGFGIVKPRLGVMLHRVAGLGLLYFILASIESCNRALRPITDHTKESLMTFIPLALIDAAICWWVFTALVQTTRTLRLRRNMVKLSLYQHFTNTLAFAVAVSVVFQLYTIRFQHLEECLTDWKELWVKDAFWHILFAIILLVIMVLWRPTNNNQRFAFSPLLDDGSDGDDEENERFLADVSDSMKQRNQRSSSSSPRESRSVEDDLKWVEENIPSSLADSTLPILDSDEEILTTKFEISKMQ